MKKCVLISSSLTFIPPTGEKKGEERKKRKENRKLYNAGG
jgi:hypothetical protein